MTIILLAAFLAQPVPPYDGPRFMDCPPSQEAEMAGQIADVDPMFLQAVIMTESRGRKDAIGDAGRSHGMWQINVGTCRGIYARCRTKDLYDAHLSSVIAGLLWRYIIKKVGRKNAAVAYNCGRNCYGKKSKRWRKSTPVTEGYFRRYKDYTEGGLCAIR